MMAVDPLVILGATALGGAISLSTTYDVARRGGRAAARATARLLRDDLSLGAAMIGVVLSNGKWWPREHRLPTRGWHEDRSPLALFLSDAEGRTLAQGFQEMDLTSGRGAAGCRGRDWRST